MSFVTNPHRRQLARVRTAFALWGAAAAPLYFAPAVHAQTVAASSETSGGDDHASLRTYRPLTSDAQTFTHPVGGNLAAIARELQAPVVKTPVLLDSLPARLGLPLLALAVLGLIGRLFARRTA